MIFLLGGKGFVGSAFERLFNAQGLDFVVLDRQNYDAHKGKSCDVFVNANGNSKKFMANRDPLWEFDASVRSVAASLSDFEIGTYLHLSTGDIYPRQDSPDVTRETDIPDPTGMSRYGLHKYTAETLVRGVHPDALIFRMGGFVGPGLKKNAIFDMLNDDPVWLSPQSDLQFISTDTAARLMWEVYTSDVRGETINLGARGTANIGQLHARIGSKSEFKSDAGEVRFEINIDKLNDLISSELPTTNTEIEQFFTALGR